MKKFFVALVVLFVAICVFAQSSTSLSDPNPYEIGADSARQSLKEVSVDLFEREASWNVYMPIDDGIITSRLFNGSPAAKDPLPAGVLEGQEDTQSSVQE